MEELIYKLNNIQPMSAGLEARLRPAIRQHLFRNGDFILRISQVARDILYIRSGLARSYYLRGRRELSNCFMREGDVCASMLSLLTQKPSLDNIIALEDCECWGIAHDELKEIFCQFPELGSYVSITKNKHYDWSDRRWLSPLRQTPEDRFARIMENDPGLVKRVTSEQLARFLNVSVATLNRMGKDYLGLRRKSGRRPGPR